LCSLANWVTVAGRNASVLTIARRVGWLRAVNMASSFDVAILNIHVKYTRLHPLVNAGLRLKIDCEYKRKFQE
jgi:hypothetical protein